MSVQFFIGVAEKLRAPSSQLILTSVSTFSSVFQEFILARVSNALSPAKLARTVQQLKCVIDFICLYYNKEQQNHLYAKNEKRLK